MPCKYSSYIALILLAYVIGSIPWAYIIAKAKGVDIRKEGSGNVGATNVSRVLGKKWGVICFILDFLKGAIPVIIVRVLTSHGIVCANPDYLMILAAIATVAGHVWPVFLNFKGGKGISTSAGTIVALAPITLILCLAIWVILFKVFRYVSLASIIAAAILPLVGFALAKYGYEKNSTPVIGLFAVLAILAIIKHKSNIVRLLKGTEHKFERKKRKNQYDTA